VVIILSSRRALPIKTPFLYTVHPGGLSAIHFIVKGFTDPHGNFFKRKLVLPEKEEAQYPYRQVLSLYIKLH
jgi:hypothetical protein